MDEMDDVLKKLENGENPVINEDEMPYVEIANRCRAISKATTISKAILALGIVAIIGGVMTIGNSAFSVIGAIAGGVLLSIAVSGWLATRNAKEEELEIHMHYIEELQKQGNFTEHEKRQQWRDFIALVNQKAAESMNNQNSGQSDREAQ